MNANEFDEWARHFGKCFPDTSAWLHGFKHKQAVVSVWREVLSDVELSDATLATMAIVRGDVEPIQAYEREQIPQRIRKLANEYRYARISARDKKKKKTYAAPESGGPGCLAAFHAVADAKRRGQDWRAVLATAFAVDPEAHTATQEAYRCVRCRDSGIRYVWGVRAVADMVAGTFGEPRSYSPAAAACDCVAGEPYRRVRETKRGTRSAAMAAYDASRLCPYDLDDVEGSAANLREWCTVKQTPANYTPAFDAFNGGGTLLVGDSQEAV